ncbi:MAG: hypothetical protein WC352_09325 [Candidatus Omnitrophota bacterium]
MKSRSKCAVLLAVVLFSLAVTGLAYAAIDCNCCLKANKAECGGTLIITDPNATDPDKLITMVECGKQDLPAVPNGSILEVFDGEFKCTVSGQDSIDITVLDHELTLKDGNAVTITSGENDGLVTMDAGTATLIDPIGEEIALKQGERYPIKLSETEAVTEALEPGGTTAENTPPPDSRGIEASPSK